MVRPSTPRPFDPGSYGSNNIGGKYTRILGSITTDHAYPLSVHVALKTTCHQWSERCLRTSFTIDRPLSQGDIGAEKVGAATTTTTKTTTNSGRENKT